MEGGLPGRIGGRPLRVGVLGAGFIGEVHARAARRAGARLVGVAASTPSSTEAAVGRLGAERGVPTPRARRVRRRSTSSTSARPTTCTGRSPRPPCRPASTSSARSRSPPARPTPSSCRSAARAVGIGRHGALRLPLLPDGPRGAGPDRRRRVRPDPPHPRRLPPGLALDASDDDNWRVDPDDVGTVAGVRRHRVALVRPRRVRHRRPAHRGLRRARHGAPGAGDAGSARPRVRDRRPRAGTAPAVDDRGHRRS